MNGVLLLACRTHGFAINRQVPMIARALRRLKAARLNSTALLSFPPNEEGGQQIIKTPAIKAC
jgi:hypothetical protein